MSETRGTAGIQVKAVVEFVGSNIARVKRNENRNAFRSSSVLDSGGSVVTAESWGHQHHEAGAIRNAELIQSTQMRKNSSDDLILRRHRRSFCGEKTDQVLEIGHDFLKEPVANLGAASKPG